MAEKERGRGDKGSGQSERQERDGEVGWGEQEMKEEAKKKKKERKRKLTEFETTSREQGSEGRRPWSKGGREGTFRQGLAGPPPGGPHIPHSSPQSW